MVQVQPDDFQAVLLIGNGPSATSEKMGKTIDAFPGQVVRFGEYIIPGYEQFVGTRTDIWWSLAAYEPQCYTAHKKRFMPARNLEDGRLTNYRHLNQPTLIDQEWFDKTSKAMNWTHPSSGAVAVVYYLHHEYAIKIWGFDFLRQDRPHHYAKTELQHEVGPEHSPEKEQAFFERLLAEGRIAWLTNR